MIKKILGGVFIEKITIDKLTKEEIRKVMLLFIDNDVSHACELIELLQKKQTDTKSIDILDNMSTLLHLYEKEKAKELWLQYSS